MVKLDATSQALLVQIAFVTVSILAAWIVLGLLKGSAQVKQKGMQFGGAAAMFVVTFFLLNKYVPEIRDGIIAEARASQAQQVVTRSDKGTADTLDVYLSPDQQTITTRDLKNLDRNRYHVDEALGVAVLRPTDSTWTVGSVSSFDKVSMMDIPILAKSFDSMRSMTSVGKLGGPIVAIRSSKAHTIALNQGSQVEDVRVDLNLFADEKYLTNVIDTSLKQQEMFGGGAVALPSDLQQRRKLLAPVFATLKAGAERMIENSLPVTKTLHNGVYIRKYSADQLVLAGVLGQMTRSMTVLDRAILEVAFSGSMTGGGRNLKVDQRRRVASFNGSSRLQSVLLDGAKTDVTVNVIGFLVAGEQSVVHVELLCLDIDGLDTSLYLKRAMDSLLFVL